MVATVCASVLPALSVENRSLKGAGNRTNAAPRWSLVRPAAPWWGSALFIRTHMSAAQSQNFALLLLHAVAHAIAGRLG